MNPPTRSPTKKRGRYHILAGGSHLGARENLPAVARFNEKSESAEVVVEYVDIEPGRAEEMVALAAERGIVATGAEARIETVIAARPKPLMLHVDSLESIAKTLVEVDSHPVPILLYLLMRLPADWLLGLRVALRAEDAFARRDFRRLIETCATVTARAGSSRVIGDEAPPGHRLAEPLYRAWFAAHATDNLAKFVAGTEPTSAPLEATLDGTTTVPLVPVFRDAFGEPRAVVREALLRPSTPLPKGTDVLVAEVVPGAVRFHEARRRVMDGAVVVRGSAGFDLPAFQKAAEESALARVIAERRLAERTREEATTTTTLATAEVLSPLYVTD